MDYQSAVRFLLTMKDSERWIEELSSSAKHDLQTMQVLMERLGHPERCAPVVHISGSKGKGSVAAMVTIILDAAGYRAGLFTSPHLHTLRERIRLGSTPVTEDEFSFLMGDLSSVVDALKPQATVFEVLTAMAFRYFLLSQVDVQVLETGLGGRLDATNVARGEVCGITSISLDHTEVLGNTIAMIAEEKAGIIKEGSLVVSGPQLPDATRAIRRACWERGAHLRMGSEAFCYWEGEFNHEGQSFTMSTPRREYDLWIPLLGTHQLENAGVAVGIVEALGERGFMIPAQAVKQGLSRVRWSGRLEVLMESPLLVVDGAHNPHSTSRLADAVSHYFRYNRVLLVMGCSGDKDLAGMALALSPLGDKVWCAKSRHPRALEPSQICDVFTRLGMIAHPHYSVVSAIEAALDEAESEDLVLVTGSLFVVAEAIEAIQGVSPEIYDE